MRKFGLRAASRRSGPLGCVSSARRFSSRKAESRRSADARQGESSSPAPARKERRCPSAESCRPRCRSSSARYQCASGRPGERRSAASSCPWARAVSPFARSSAALRSRRTTRSSSPLVAPGSRARGGPFTPSRQRLLRSPSGASRPRALSGTFARSSVTCVAPRSSTHTNGSAGLFAMGSTARPPRAAVQTGSTEGMQTMDQALQQLVDKKRITPEDAYWKAIDKTLFAAQCTNGIIE